jgi:hypothetical protein
MIKSVLKRRVLWWVAIAAAVIGGGVLSVGYTLNRFGACDNAVLNTIASPDGSKVIVIFRKQCNATVPDSTQASLASAALGSPAEKVPPFFVIAGTPTITADWRGDRSVEIAVIPAGGKIFRNQASVGDIKIEYK